jgi:YD repeat-containing protein
LRLWAGYLGTAKRKRRKLISRAYGRQGLPSTLPKFRRKTCPQVPAGAGLRALRDPTGHVWRWELDSLSNVTAATDPAGAVTRFSYDAKSRLTRVLRPSGSEVCCGYDNELNLTSYVDELGHDTRFDYGFVNRLTARHLPNGTTVRYDYDTENRLTAVINGRGERYSLLRDAAGRITSEIDYWGRLTNYGYDEAGQIVQSVDPLGRLTRMERDPLGRLTARLFADGSSERFDYDPPGNLVATESPHGTVTRRFDSEGRLVSEDQAGFEVQFGYDPAGNLVRRTSTAGNRVEYAYDAADRLSAIQVNDETDHRIERDSRGLPVHRACGGAGAVWITRPRRQLRRPALPLRRRWQRHRAHDQGGNAAVVLGLRQSAGPRPRYRPHPHLVRMRRPGAAADQDPTGQDHPLRLGRRCADGRARRLRLAGVHLRAGRAHTASAGRWREGLSLRDRPGRVSA